MADVENEREGMEKECGRGEPVRRDAISPIRQDDIRPVRRMSAYERTRAQVYATGNRWAIENFEATHG